MTHIVLPIVGYRRRATKIVLVHNNCVSSAYRMGRGAVKNHSDFYVLTLFEVSTLTTKTYNLSLNTLKTDKLIETKKF